MSKLTDAQKRYIEKLQPGQRASGVVKSFTDFGAFVSIGLISGLLHNKNIRWGRVEHPEHHLRKGQKIEVIILEVDKERHRVSFGLKQLQPDPWDKFVDKYKPGDTIAATILMKKPFGLIMEVVSGIEALLHVSELPQLSPTSNAASAVDRGPSAADRGPSAGDRGPSTVDRQPSTAAAAAASQQNILDSYHIDETYEVTIVEIDTDARKLRLSLR
jgi:ribosomal protein S1